MNSTGMMLAFGKAFLASLVLTPIVRDIFRSYNVVDRPGRRKVHAYPIPRVGGIPIAIAFFLVMLSLRGTDSPFPAHWLQTVLSGALIIFFIGLVDDFANLRPTVKLMGQIVAGAVAFYNGIRIDQIGDFSIPVVIALPLTIFWLLLTMNALNLIDGLDGLCGGVGFWGTVAFFLAALINGNMALAFTVLPLAGALCAFLFFNFNPATVFLGDSGALLIGFLLGCFGIVWADHQITPITIVFPVFVLCVPMLDLGLSIVRRSLKNQPIFSADRGHIHHRLLDRGLSVRRAASALYGAEITGIVFGLLLNYLAFYKSGRWYLVLDVAVLLSGVITLTIGVRFLRYAEFEVAAGILFNGEFRTVFAQKLRMQQLGVSLKHARTVEEWWRILTAAAHDENWIRLRWNAGRVLREEHIAERAPSWLFVIELGSGESIQVEGDTQSARRSSDLVALSDVVSRSFLQSRHEWEPSAHS